MCVVLINWMLRISFRGAAGLEGELVATGVTGLLGALSSFGPSDRGVFTTGGALGGGTSRGGWNGAVVGGGGRTGSALMMGALGGAAGGEPAVTTPLPALPPITCDATAWFPAMSCTIIRT